MTEYLIKDEKLRSQIVFCCRRLQQAILISIVLLWLFAFTVPASAQDETIPLPSHDPILEPVAVATETPFHMLEPLPLQRVRSDSAEEKESGLIDSILHFFGLGFTGDFIAISLNDTPLAIVPTDSKFADLPVHDVCLQFQYGTDNWYECEMLVQVQQ